MSSSLISFQSLARMSHNGIRIGIRQSHEPQLWTILLVIRMDVLHTGGMPSQENVFCIVMPSPLQRAVLITVWE